MTESVGIYILTYPKDFHLARTLIASIRYFAPDIPISLIPGPPLPARDISRARLPFDGVSVLERPDEFGWADDVDMRFRAMNTFWEWGMRKFWAFAGEYERFMYIDADCLRLRNFQSVIPRVMRAQEPFIFVNFGEKHRETGLKPREILREATFNEAQKYFSRRLGNITAIEEFDPRYDFWNALPFNSGLWASSRQSLPPERLRELLEREREFEHERAADGADCGYEVMGRLFYSDQGRLNYLVQKNEFDVHDLAPDAHYRWGGLPLEVSREQVAEGGSPVPFIHWAGVPRPSESLFCSGPLFSLNIARASEDLRVRKLREVPGLDIWLMFSGNSGWKRVAHTISDLRYVALPGVKMTLKRRCGCVC